MSGSLSNRRILVVDDHAIVRQGCVHLLQSSNADEIIQASSGESAYQEFLKHSPDLVVIDLSMEGVGGLETIRRIKQHNDSVGIVVFSMHDDPSIVSRALSVGADGYVSKSNGPEVLLEAVQQISDGGVYLSQDVAQSIALSDMKSDADPLSDLTKREFEILGMLVQGLSNAEIARKINLSHKSVSNYYLRIKQRLGARNLADLVRIGISNGIVKKNVLPGP